VPPQQLRQLVCLRCKHPSTPLIRSSSQQLPSDTSLIPPRPALSHRPATPGSKPRARDEAGRGRLECKPLKAAHMLWRVVDAPAQQRVLKAHAPPGQAEEGLALLHERGQGVGLGAGDDGLADGLQQRVGG